MLPGTMYICYRTKVNSGENFLTLVNSQFSLSPNPGSRKIGARRQSKIENQLRLKNLNLDIILTCNIHNGFCINFYFCRQ